MYSSLRAIKSPPRGCTQVKSSLALVSLSLPVEGWEKDEPVSPLIMQKSYYGRAKRVWSLCSISLCYSYARVCPYHRAKTKSIGRRVKYVVRVTKMYILWMRRCCFLFFFITLAECISLPGHGYHSRRRLVSWARRRGVVKRDGKKRSAKRRKGKTTKLVTMMPLEFYDVCPSFFPFLTFCSVIQSFLTLSKQEATRAPKPIKERQNMQALTYVHTEINNIRYLSSLSFKNLRISSSSYSLVLNPACAHVCV
jgi:hypothetical protein